MTTKTTYSHIVDGEIFTRKSAREYTHVVVINDGGVWSWHANQELAMKALRKFNSWGHTGRVEQIQA